MVWFELDLNYHYKDRRCLGRYKWVYLCWYRYDCVKASQYTTDELLFPIAALNSVEGNVKFWRGSIAYTSILHRLGEANEPAL